MALVEPGALHKAGAVSHMEVAVGVVSWAAAMDKDKELLVVVVVASKAGRRLEMNMKTAKVEMVARQDLDDQVDVSNALPR